MREVLQICIAYTKIFTFLVTKNLGELSLLENSVVILQEFKTYTQNLKPQFFLTFISEVHFNLPDFHIFSKASNSSYICERLQLSHFIKVKFLKASAHGNNMCYFKKFWWIPIFLTWVTSPTSKKAMASFNNPKTQDKH